MIELRDYQERALDDVREAYRRGLRKTQLVAPTGAGKTVIFSAIARNATQLGKRVMILVHRQELMDQVSETLGRFDVPHGHIVSGITPKRQEPVQVASVMSLVRRIGNVHTPDLIIIDEAHHAVSDTYERIIAAFPESRLLGVTATPCRMGGAGLGDVFDTLVMGPSVQELTDAGHLAPARVFAPATINTDGMRTIMGEFVRREVEDRVDRPTVTGDAISHYQRLTPGKRAVVFCVSLEHARHIADGARAAGITAVMVDGGMDTEIRRRVMADFKGGLIQWLVSVDLIQEGFDCPGIEVGIFLRPTQSLGLWLQQAGRCLRTYEGKPHATLLDHAGNALRHGLPSDDRDWTLETGKRRGKRELSVSVKICPRCFAGQRTGRPTCVHCGWTFPVEARKVASEDGELEEITPEQLARRAERREQGQAQTLAQLTEIARIKGYKPDWAKHVMEARMAKRKKDEVPS